LALSAVGAPAADRAAYRDGDIEVVVLTSPLPKELAGSEADADSQWFGVRTMVGLLPVPWTPT
jgi:hypothetical protein